ncbi:hypothetical protein C8J56DRAFT_1019636 [Mycena floridula]|nr:hypothetical protein C8J56DRAFT_1019636 [Mycena floridula]
MDDFLQQLLGDNRAKRPRGLKPAFIKLHPSDDGTGLPDAFFEHPDSYKKNVGPDGRIRSWGFYPYIPEGKKGAGFEDTSIGPALMGRKMMHQMTYAPLSQLTKLIRPEEQFLKAVMARKKRELKGVDLGDLTRRDYVLRIHMPEIQTESGEDRIWRRFVVSGGMSLGVFQDKVLAPLMGWVRNFHVHILTDYRDGTQYGPKAGFHEAVLSVELNPCFQNSGSVDMMHIDAVEEIAALQESYGAVQVLGGSGICPMENGRGNVTWAENLQKLKTGKPSEQTYRAVTAALGSKGSFAPGAKVFNMPLTPEGISAGSPRANVSRKTTKEITVPETDSIAGGHWEELKKDGRDSSRSTACAACGSPHDLKACSGCRQRFYCSAPCQKGHWKSTHKRECEELKKKNQVSV